MSKSLMKSWKKIYSWSFQILSATTHLVILFSFVYISHNNTYILVIFKVLIISAVSLFYFKMNGVKMSPRSVLFYGQIEKYHIFTLDLLTLYAFSRELGCWKYFFSFINLIFNRKRQ